MQRFNTHRRVADPRQGSMVLLAGVALLVVGAAIALVLDRLWIDAAQTDLVTAAEAAALAAAGELANDNLLVVDPDHAAIINSARLKAAEFANKNNHTTGPVVLNTDDSRDIVFGRIVIDPDSGLEQLLETDAFPSSVLVVARRNRKNGNAVALFFRELTGQDTADLISKSEASIDNRVVGLRPFEGAPVPAMPLAILEDHVDPKRLDTWAKQIEQQLGSDNYGFDATTNQVTTDGDGIPEIMLWGAKANPDKEDVPKVNVNWIDVGNGLHGDLIASQIGSGWTSENLEGFGGELRFGSDEHVVDADACLENEGLDALENSIGQTRICLLYNGHKSTGSQGIGRVRVTRPVAVRVLKVSVNGAGQTEIVVQPTVLTTKTALLAADNGAWSTNPEDNQTNPYIYKLHRTQ